MQLPSSNSNNKRKKFLCIALPILTFIVLALIPELQKEQLIQYDSRMHFFFTGYPALFALSYICFIRDLRYRTNILFISSLLISVYIFLQSAFLAIAGVIYACFILSIFSVIKSKVLPKGLIVTTLFVAFACTLKLYSELYVYLIAKPIGLKRFDNWEQFFLGGLFLDSIFLVSWMYFDLVSRKKPLEISNLKVIYYAFNPIFLIRHVPISLRELYNKPTNSEKPNYALILKGWGLLLRGLTLIFLSSTLWPDVKSFFDVTYHTGIKDWFRVYSTFQISVGFLMIFGFDIAQPFDDIWKIRHPLDYWRRWNVYTRKWLVHFYFVPLIKKTKNIYVSFIFTFVASGIVLFTPYVFVGTYAELSKLFKYFVHGLAVATFLFVYVHTKTYFERVSKKTVLFFSIVGSLVTWTYVLGVRGWLEYVVLRAEQFFR